MELNYVKQSDSNSLIKEFDEIVHLEKSQIIFLYISLI